jgi:hypothetical protein
MKQTDPSATSNGTQRSARPQLFGAPSAANRHADFENSILATIDGGQTRLTGKSKSKGRRTSRTGPLMLAGVVLAAAGAYAVAHFSDASSAPTAMPPLLQAAASPEASPAPLTPPPSPVMDSEPAASPADANLPGAVIETVVDPTPQKIVEPVIATAPPQASPQPAAVAPPPVLAVAPEASPGPAGVTPAAAAAAAPPQAAPAATAHTKPRPTRAERLASQRAARQEAQAKKEKEARRARLAAAKQAAKPVQTAKKPAGKPGPTAENDTALLAAVLPHFQRHSNHPGSSAYDQRCGKLSGAEAESCRVRFCNGRQGTDAACPANPAPDAESGP